MSSDEYAELEALKQDQAYDDWLSNVTDPELHRRQETRALWESLLEPIPDGDPEAEGIVASLRERDRMQVCRMCGKVCPAGYMRGHVCVDCETMSGELLDPKLKL